MWLSIELLAHACFYIRICTTRGSLPHVVIIISAYCITISLSSACTYKPEIIIIIIIMCCLFYGSSISSNIVIVS